MIIGKRPPSEDTPGIVGQEYFDDSSDTTYICVKVSHITSKIPGEHDTKYEWRSASGASSWNDLTDKPFGEEYSPTGGDTLTWDGVDKNVAAGVAAISLNTLKNSKVTYQLSDYSGNIVEEGTAVVQAYYVEALITCGALTVWYAGTHSDAPQSYGWYFGSNEDVYISSLTVEGFTGFPGTTVKPLDTKYLPMEEIIAAVKAAMSTTE